MSLAPLPTRFTRPTTSQPRQDRIPHLTPRRDTRHADSGHADPGSPPAYPPRLDPCIAARLHSARCQMAGWPLPAPFTGRGEESPGSTEPGCRVTPGGDDPRESATENIPPAPPCADLPVRVKRCGKSAPPGRQRAGHGKPHPEQDHVGTRVAHWRYVCLLYTSPSPRDRG